MEESSVMWCPTCKTRLVERVHGQWCPVCRGWLVEEYIPPRGPDQPGSRRITISRVLTR